MLCSAAAIPVIDSNKASQIPSHVQFVEADVTGVGKATDGEQNTIAFNRRLAIALHNTFSLHNASTRHPHPEPEFQALFLQNFLSFSGDFGIHPRQDPVEIFQDGHFRAKPRPDTSQFQSNDTRANHH